MANDKFLYETLGERAWKLRILEPLIEDYSYITDNLKYPLFDWQEKALINFFTNEKLREVEQVTKPNHLLFNMATGSGKTLVMASVILYYYKQGYRNFLFFVNQNNIVDKTEDNFTNPYHNKYLFKESIVIDNKNININKVDAFGDETDDIQIKFTSIQQLHADIYKVKEDSILLSDLQNRKLILLGDEAHHLNSQTKKGKQQEIEEFTIEAQEKISSAKDIERSWEHTVIDLILNKGGKYKGANKNALLEFTATVDKNKDVAQKYIDKIIYKFDISDFLKAGYTKEINLVSSSFDKKQRVLQALLFNWYRWYIAVKNGINLKPVILFRSKTIDDSFDDYNNFRDWVDNLTVQDFDFLDKINRKEVSANGEVYKLGQSRILKIKALLDDENSDVELSDIVSYIRRNFKDNINCIVTNSKDKTAKGLDGKEKTTSEQDKLLNNLEDKSNQIRAIFTVQRLTEGWDVLNLFDIVRLYEGQVAGKDDKGKQKSGQSTVSEVQLIGRGVRYYPFKYKDSISNKRKFDDDLENDLRVLEELYFHSDRDERYIQELKKELKDQKLWEDNKVIKSFKLRSEIVEKDTYLQKMNIWFNKKIDNPDRKKKDIEAIKSEWRFEATIDTPSIKEASISLDQNADDKVVLSSGNNNQKTTLNVKISEIDRPLLLKAINTLAQKENSLYRFQNLKEELEVDSINDLLYINKPFFGNFNLSIVVDSDKCTQGLSDTENLMQQDRKEVLNILIKFFSTIESKLKEMSNPYIGTEFDEKEKLITLFKSPKEKSVIQEDIDRLKDKEQELTSKEWYLLDGYHGTSEETSLVEFLNNQIGNFKNRGYDKVYLLRNEEVYKIYDYDTGRGFQPDFLLFLGKERENISYQIFIEPKGGNLLDHDEWKNIFLKQITDRYKDEVLTAENKDYRLVGLPLYNESKTEKEVDEYIKEHLF